MFHQRGQFLHIAFLYLINELKINVFCQTSTYFLIIYITTKQWINFKHVMYLLWQVIHKRSLENTQYELPVQNYLSSPSLCYWNYIGYNKMNFYVPFSEEAATALSASQLSTASHLSQSQWRNLRMQQLPPSPLF